MIEQSLAEISSHPDYQVLKRAPMELKETYASPSSKVFMTTIIDLGLIPYSAGLSVS